MAALSGGHLCPFTPGVVAVADQVQRPVDYVKQEFIRRGIAVSGGCGSGGVGAGDDLAFQPAFAPLEDEAQNIGRLVLPEVLPVQSADRAIVDDRQADLRLHDALVVEDGTDGAAEQAAVDGKRSLPIGDLDADQAVTPFSGPGT